MSARTYFQNFWVAIRRALESSLRSHSNLGDDDIVLVQKPESRIRTGYLFNWDASRDEDMSADAMRNGLRPQFLDDIDSLLFIVQTYVHHLQPPAHDGAQPASEMLNDVPGCSSEPIATLPQNATTDAPSTRKEIKQWLDEIHGALNQGTDGAQSMGEALRRLRDNASTIRESFEPNTEHDFWLDPPAIDNFWRNFLSAHIPRLDDSAERSSVISDGASDYDDVPERRTPSVHNPAIHGPSRLKRPREDEPDEPGATPQSPPAVRRRVTRSQAAQVAQADPEPVPLLPRQSLRIREQASRQTRSNTRAREDASLTQGRAGSAAQGSRRGVPGR